MITYTYDTGRVSHFALRKVEHDCDKSGRSILVGVFCRQCPFYNGQRGKYVICTGCEKDDEGASELRQKIYDEIENRALCALDY